MSALEIAAAVRTGERSALAIVDEHLARIEAGDGEIHAFNAVTADLAREQAAAVDATVAAGGDPDAALRHGSGASCGDGA